jgi:hypothetical protein
VVVVVVVVLEVVVLMEQLVVSGVVMVLEGLQALGVLLTEHQDKAAHNQQVVQVFDYLVIDGVQLDLLCHFCLFILEGGTLARRRVN